MVCRSILVSGNLILNSSTISNTRAPTSAPCRSRSGLPKSLVPIKIEIISGLVAAISGMASNNPSVDPPGTAKFLTSAKSITSAQFPDAVMLSPANTIFEILIGLTNYLVVKHSDS